MRAGWRLVAVVLAGCVWSVCAGQEAGSVGGEADRTQPGGGALPVVTVAAKGVQIYRCEGRNDGPALWVFVGSEATLFASTEDGAEVLGTHGTGPVWRWKDGSAVAGKVLVKQDAGEPAAVPWLLLQGSPAKGGSAKGVLTGVGYVRRFETHGGVEPTSGCDAGHLLAEARVPYAAKYTFYRASTR